jgi:hypothetical protein
MYKKAFGNPPANYRARYIGLDHIMVMEAGTLSIRACPERGRDTWRKVRDREDPDNATTRNCHARA